MAQFLEEISQKVEGEEGRQLCHATAQEYRVSAQNYQQRIEREEATAGEMGSHLNLFPCSYSTIGREWRKCQARLRSQGPKKPAATVGLNPKRREFGEL